MKTDPQPFLNPDPEYTALETAAVVILPIPYEGGVSYGTGARPLHLQRLSRHRTNWSSTMRC